MLAHSDSTMPNPKADHAFRREPVPLFHNSTVAEVSNPSTISGQIAAVVASAPYRSANSRPWRYDAYAAPRATSPVHAHWIQSDQSWGRIGHHRYGADGDA